MNKILTIGIPAYNMEKYLSTCVDSLVTSKHLDELDIIIVNDGSKDDTLRIAQDYERKFASSIRVIDKENGGHGSGINQSLEAACGSYFKILDGDDWFDTEELDKLIEILKHCSEDIIIMPFKTVNEETNEIINVECPSLLDSYGAVVDNIEQISSMYKMHALCFRTDALKRNPRRITEKCFYVDQEYILYPIGFVKSYRYVDTYVYQYRLGRADQSVNWKNMIKNRSMHERVIFDLHEDYSSKELSAKEKALYCQHISDLLVKQIAIFLHMKLGLSSYKEFKAFLDAVKEYSDAEKNRKIIKVFSRFPVLYFGGILLKSRIE